MTDDEDITPTPRPSPGTSHDYDEMTRQIDALTEMVGRLVTNVASLRSRLEALEHGDTGDDSDNDTKPHDRPAGWVLFTPPAAAEDRAHQSQGHTPSWTVDNFVRWYNQTFLGLPGTVNQPIPPCWSEHPGLALEVATLAYAWRRSNVGPTANIRDAQHWHDRWRPGFLARLPGYVHAHCLDGRHKQVGATFRADRFSPRTEPSADGKEDPTLFEHGGVS